MFSFILLSLSEQPAWLSIQAIILYGIIIVSLAVATLCIIVMRRQKKASDEKMRILVNAAHDIRTPLTLIKAPLEEIAEQETLSENGQNNINTALRNVNSLLGLTANLIDVEQADSHTDSLHISTAPTAASADGKKKREDAPAGSPTSRILIVEDNDELREYLRNTLSETYHVRTCPNGKEALSTLKDYLPHLIISDIMMPEMSGDELCRILKSDIDTSHIPIILLTASNTDKSIIEDLQSGADEYIVKPFNIGVLRATIANLLKNRALLRHKYANLELNDGRHDTECINCSSDIDWKFIATVKKQVEENMNNPGFNVEVLCGLLNMSRTSFYNKITALTDQPPGDYIRLIKLKRASHLLMEHKYTITEIAEMTGFNDAKYFREVFKKHFKVSPSQYAKGQGNEQNV